MLSKLAYLTLCRSMQVLMLLARGDARGVSEVDRLSCCAFVFVDQAAEDVAAVELPRCG